MSRPIIGPSQIFNTSAFTNAASAIVTIVSQPVFVKYADNIGVQFNWQGATSGTLFIDASIDYIATPVSYSSSAASSSYFVQNIGNFVQIISSTAFAPQPNGSSGSCLLNITETPYSWIRGRFMNAARTSALAGGTLDMWVIGKELG